MADPRTIKKNLLQDLMQRARSSTQVGGPKFLSSHNSSLKGNRSSPKSPKVKSTRQSIKRLHFPSVFRSHKDPTSTSTTTESKTDSLKENARRSGAGRNKRPKSYCEEEKVQISVPQTGSPVFQTKREAGEKRDKTLADKILQAIIEKHTPQKEKLKNPKQENSKTPQHVLYTTFQDHNLKSLLQNEKQITVIPWKQSKSIPTSPGRSLTTKVSYCKSCGHVEEKTELKEQKKEQTVENTAVESGAKQGTASEEIKICQAGKTVKQKGAASEITKICPAKETVKQRSTDSEKIKICQDGERVKQTGAASKEIKIGPTEETVKQKVTVSEEIKICPANETVKQQCTASEEIKICPAEETVKIPPKFTKNQRTTVTKSPVKSHSKLFRSLSDPTSSPRKDQKPRILYKQCRKVKEAKITQTQTLQRRNYTRRHTDTDLIESSNEQTIADLKKWKDQIRQNTTLFSESGKAISAEYLTKSTMAKHKNGNIEDFYPLLRTKIPEEYIQEDGSMTLRKGSVGVGGVKKMDADRDLGVEVDNASKIYYRFNSNESEIENDTETTVTPDRETSVTDIQTPDSLLESAGENEMHDFDVLKISQKLTMAAEEVQETKGHTRALKRRITYLLEERTAWDMYALLRRFECIEWELTPASNLKRQTLDLDNCDLDSVPAAVTEIEYYAFRDVEAVSLNHNRKIENADVLGKLADLRVINMWGCNLKSIPQTWSRLTKLQMLGLGNNQNLTHFGPLKHLTNVVWLDLGGCGLKRLPDEVTNMMKLKVLALGANQGIEIGDEICCLWDLKKLGLNDCELEEIPKSVFSLTKLTHLHLDNNYITHINQEIVQLVELEELTVTGNNNISFPKILSQCDTIRCIVVDESKDLSRVSGTLKKRMRSMPTAISPVHKLIPKARHASVS